MPLRWLLKNLARQRQEREAQRAEPLIRASRYEAFEDRLALSADPALQLPLDPFGADITQVTSTVSPSTTAVDYGLDYVRSTYGFPRSGQTVAVIDSGIAYDHPALGGFGASYRVVGGWDFAENDANPYDDAPAGFHGTHVAGILGSSDAMHRGVAPGVDLVGLRVFDDQGATEFAWVEQALRWVHEHRHAFENPITVVNLSLGLDWNGAGPPPSAQFEDELSQLHRDGIFVAVSAGNSFAKYNAPGVGYPAASPYVTPVTSVGADGNLSGFSQRSARVIAAPGERITSTVPDYAHNLNGRTDDFERSTGTSMATPFVAGAAVLVREAMTSAGRTSITPEDLYNHLYNTADLVFDPATNANYHRINIGRAIDAALPADDYGSTVADAYSLGRISGDRTLSGVIHRTSDIDYFQFTAGATGTVRFHSQTAGNLTTEWRLPGGSENGSATVALEVISGRTYTIGLAPQAGAGSYDVSIDLTPQIAAANWGFVSFNTFADQSVVGEETLRTVRATRDGILTIEAFFTHSQGNINLEAYDARGNLLASSRSRGNGERIDVSVAASQTLTLKIVGANADVDFRLTNLVSASAGVIDVIGTRAADQFSFATGTSHLIQVNGVQYTFEASEFDAVRFHGGRGADEISLTGTGANERLTARPGDIAFTGGRWNVTAVGVEVLEAAGGGRRDTAVLYDSRGNDNFFGSPTQARLMGNGFDHRLSGFATVEVQAGHRYDTAVLSDSAGDDTFTARPQAALLIGDGYRQTLQGFDNVRAIATGGFDRAVLYDGAGADSFVAQPGMATMRSGAAINFAAGFDEVHAYATAGNNTAWLFDSSGNDRLAAAPGEVVLIGPGFKHTAAGFGVVRATATAGGLDRADFFRVTGDEFRRTSAAAIHRGSGFLHIASDFEQVSAAGAVLRQNAFREWDQADLNVGALSLTAADEEHDQELCAAGALFQELGELSEA